MERKIGEIFEYGGEWYQCVNTGNCSECAFRGKRCYEFSTKGVDIVGDCSGRIFKKLKKAGETYEYFIQGVGIIMVQEYILANPRCICGDDKHLFVMDCQNGRIAIEVKQNTEDMETNEKTITVPDGWEFDRIDDSGNIVLKEKKKELPKTWAGCLRIVDDAEMIDECSDIRPYNVAYETDGGHIFDSADHNILPLGLGKPMLALCQLLVCRNAWWQQLGWKPDWEKPEEKHCIVFKCDGVEKQVKTYESCILAFPKYEVRNQFLDTFRDLIEEAKELL